MPNPYTASSSIATSPVFLNAQSFQIISAGRDRSYGLGGIYLGGASTERLPVDASGAYAGSPGASDLPAARLLEHDNLTNFSGGKLE